ncbi:aminotransferase class I/II-fold pyridoxal phosphate-dependent enzyme [Streptomyces sp. NPDC049915]|uniref:aminotransferase class I/II-fold pyridoxal phosphate-dependent enzyme n=1 Tax=Streptomyces sp. NPDC049915 TaxID=3155510 RepID=UPI00343DB795
MHLSHCGTKMAGASGLRSIMEDVALSGADTSAGPWLNLSVGNPAAIPEVTALWRELAGQALAEDFERSSAVYGPSRGSRVLVDAVVEYFRTGHGWDIGPENVVVGPGSQMLCFAAAALFTGPGRGGDRRLLLPLVPDYTGYQGLCLHEGGVEGLAPLVRREEGHRFRYAMDLDALRRRRDMGMLLVSSPGNPTGRPVERAELDALTEVATELDVPLLIDHAYGAPFPRIADVRSEPAPHPQVINSFTVSKAGLPGERIGFAVGAPHHISALTGFLANSVLHAPQLSQAMVARALATGRLDHVTATVIGPYYQNKRRFAEKMLHEYLPEDLQWRLHSGTGGMFCWVWVDHDWFDDLELYRRLKDKRVFAVPGRHFFTDASDPALDGHGRRCFRISLSGEEPVIAEGVHRIAEALREMAADGA